MKRTWHRPLDNCAGSCIEYNCVNILNKKQFFHFFTRNRLSMRLQLCNDFILQIGYIVTRLSTRSLPFVLVEENKYFWKTADISRLIPPSGRVDNRTDTRSGFETIRKINKKPGRISPPSLATPRTADNSYVWYRWNVYAT